MHSCELTDEMLNASWRAINRVPQSLCLFRIICLALVGVLDPFIKMTLPLRRNIVESDQLVCSVHHVANGGNIHSFNQSEVQFVARGVVYTKLWVLDFSAVFMLLVLLRAATLPTSSCVYPLRDWSSGRPRFQSFSRFLIIVSGKVSLVVNLRTSHNLYNIIGYNSRKRTSHRVYTIIIYNRCRRDNPQTLPNQ